MLNNSNTPVNVSTVKLVTRHTGNVSRNVENRRDLRLNIVAHNSVFFPVHDISSDNSYVTAVAPSFNPMLKRFSALHATGSYVYFSSLN